MSAKDDMIFIGNKNQNRLDAFVQYSKNGARLGVSDQKNDFGLSHSFLTACVAILCL